MCLDVLRALSREPRSLDVLATFLQRNVGRDARYGQYVNRLLGDLRAGGGGEVNARELTERIALATQADILLEGGSSAAAEAFLASRIAIGAPGAFGVLSAKIDHGALIGRAFSPQGC